MRVRKIVEKGRISSTELPWREEREGKKNHSGNEREMRKRYQFLSKTQVINTILNSMLRGCIALNM
jgi:hypothetical protein